MPLINDNIVRGGEKFLLNELEKIDKPIQKGDYVLGYKLFPFIGDNLGIIYTHITSLQESILDLYNLYNRNHNKKWKLIIDGGDHTFYNDDTKIVHGVFPFGQWEQKGYINLFNLPPNLLKIYANNVSSDLNIFDCIPLGVQERTDINLIGNNIRKNKLLYVNFRLRCLRRKQIMDHFAKTNYALVEQKTKLDISEKTKEEASERIQEKVNNSSIKLSKSCFAISPAGLGLDCYRTWEALMFYCFPVVEYSKIYDYFEDFPIVTVDRFEEIDYNFLRQNLNKMLENWKQGKYNFEKLNKNYWTNKIIYES